MKNHYTLHNKEYYYLVISMTRKISVSEDIEVKTIYHHHKSVTGLRRADYKVLLSI